ncbi:hypothetical protein A3SI_19651 [Nitritalea halalkaliphila LW7]|uniref:Uncharacterized protein n=1 Tax=Nitritalea halalkaliphila LW7 TaxID=1189621 RepID=I5BSM0_9BACT|nr:hypothetical protein [Nitritalea halalkaliphila]EIM72572.1 hypothetical protein A3SI_19651 [Nitritalea halalkaliphila LW7]
MNTYNFTCTLLSEVVLNASLATEGNMSSLDYIPGSNFLGIAASHLYKDRDSSEAYQLFHSGEVKFGDARVASNACQPTYQVPFSFYQEKGEDNLIQSCVYLHHLLSSDNYPLNQSGARNQLRQSRSGYLTIKSVLANKVAKRFSLKSAYDREKRTSLTGAMFGFEAIAKGTVFIFSVMAEDQALLDRVAEVLIGRQRLGKSKTAEFGQVLIEKKDNVDILEVFSSEEYTLVYAESNLCFFDEVGQPTFQPSATDLGLDGGTIDWSKSQIRTYSYSPWNGIRKTTSTQRHCIAKGSVFYVVGANPKGSTLFVGHHQAEGLGKVIYNPLFLKPKEVGSCSPCQILRDTKNEKLGQASATALSDFLTYHKNYKLKELLTSQYVAKKVDDSQKGSRDKFKGVSSSQWGNIRSIASRSQSSDEMYSLLFKKEKGYLMHGIAYEKCWGLQKEEKIRYLKEILESVKSANSDGVQIDVRVFLTRFAAEMAKSKKRNN